jgi:tetratricopeptide (TPR) repeat protein
LNEGWKYRPALFCEQQLNLIRDYTKVIALNPDSADAYAYRGLAYSLLQNTDRAIIDLEKSCIMGSEKGCELLQMVSEE